MDLIRFSYYYKSLDNGHDTSIYFVLYSLRLTNPPKKKQTCIFEVELLMNLINS